MTDSMKRAIRNVIELGDLRQKVAEASSRMEQATKEHEEAAADMKRLNAIAAEYSSDVRNVIGCKARWEARSASSRLISAEFSRKRAKWALDSALREYEWYTESLKSDCSKRDKWDIVEDVRNAVVFMVTSAFFVGLFYLMIHYSMTAQLNPIIW